MELSIVLPVYNCECYIENCLKSILCNSYKDFEVIIVNDGSSDRSLDILQRYESIDNRIRVFTITNKGAAQARNFGVQMSSGKYITFIDSDDTVTNDCFKKMIFYAEKFDCADFIQFGENLKGITDSDYVFCNRISAIRYFAEGKVFSGNVWSKIYKSKAIKDIVMFGGLAEDQIYILKAIEHNYYFASVGGVKIYNYRLNENSITHQQFGVFQQSYIIFLEMLYHTVAKYHMDMKNAIKNKYLIKCWVYCCLSGKYKFEGYKYYIKKYINVLKNEIKYIRESAIPLVIKVAVELTLRCPSIFLIIFGRVISLYRSYRNRIKT